jgi:hypothetical protein
MRRAVHFQVVSASAVIWYEPAAIHVSGGNQMQSHRAYRQSRTAQV